MIMSLHFKDAPAGKVRKTVYRIDDAMKWDNDHLKLIPVEDRVTYVHNDFSFFLLVPADSVVMVTLDYEAFSKTPNPTRI